MHRPARNSRVVRSVAGIDDRASPLNPNNPLAATLVDATIAGFDDRTGLARAAHACGVGARGYFEPSGVVARYSNAPAFRRDLADDNGHIPVVVRFSNGSGNTTRRDSDTDARGMAVKLWPGESYETDLVAMTMPVFFAKDVAGFLAFAEAARPQRIPEPSWWASLRAKLALLPSPQKPRPDGRGSISEKELFGLTQKHPEAKNAVGAAAGLPTPWSYHLAVYHGVHAFRVTNDDGDVRYIKYRWTPIDGARATTNDGDDFLPERLEAQLAGTGTARFALFWQIGDSTDAVDDPTQEWPASRKRISAGDLVLTDFVSPSEIDALSFNPLRLHPGFEGSPTDELLWARGGAYQNSCQRRGGSGCPLSSITID